MHYKNVKSILSAKNGMNIYRGCSHGCIYCDSRSKVYNMDHEFEDIEIKENSLVLLKKALKSKRKKVMVGIGAMSDPYMPIEKHLKYTRNSLKLIQRYGHGFTCITKSDLVLRDIDILKSLKKAVIQMTITTSDDELCSMIEPNVAKTSRRVEALKKLNEEGIPTVVWLTPILPFINDNKDNIKSIVEYCADANVYGIICFEMGLTLREGNREHFYLKLDERFPGLKEKYMKEYGERYSLPSKHNRHLMKIFKKRAKDEGIITDTDEIFNYLQDFPVQSVQTTLF